MISEAMKRIEDLAKQANAVEILKGFDPNNPEVVYVVNRQTGEIKPHEITRRKRVMSAFTIESFVQATSEYGGLTTVWVSLDEVRCLVEDDPEMGGIPRSDEVVLAVNPSHMFAVVSQFPKEQERLVAFLHHNFRDAIIEPSHFTLAVSNMRFQNVSTSVGEFGTLKSKMGKDIVAEVTPGGDIPQEVTIRFIPYPSMVDEGLDDEVEVACSVRVDPAEEEIIVTPFPGQIEMAQKKAIKLLMARIVELADDTTVIAGTPF